MSHSPSASVWSPSPQTPPKPYPQFILFGDSITQMSTAGLLCPLSERYNRRMDVLNRGMSGYTSRMGLDVLRHWFPSRPPSDNLTPQVKLMTLFFGANDATLPGCPQHVPLHAYTGYLRDIVNHPGIASHDTKIILVTPPPVDEWQLGDQERTASNTRAYAAACRQLGRDLGLPTLDLWTMFMTKAGWREDDDDRQKKPLIGSKAAPRNQVLADLLSDGLHFTPAAYQIVFDALLELIQTHLPDYVPDKLPFVYPDWKDQLGVVSALP
ncbi:uncharacterized protein PV06_06755 [Exophiala oligosperma]|uniref:SGNH hydrolase-type esterase domain-containing protein n=2 Tax=Chaetothyriales TaxID=34395 RepID=A0A0D2DDP0_9EURO|nr:uncharacterized protein PV06_06755 [Exophiala oligosperma]KAJ9633449.1 hypothetical protein H2204_006999 [Knufia peltigerae]KIW41173.1 hypothetical protein PV06_06755 [Exophiala oligosperma]